jgi:hypothetical protein
MVHITQSVFIPSCILSSRHHIVACFRSTARANPVAPDAR